MSAYDRRPRRGLHRSRSCDEGRYAALKSWYELRYPQATPAQYAAATTLFARACKV